MIIKTDDGGRALCPECGSRLYLKVVERYYGLPAHYDHNECRFVYDTWDSHSTESDIDRLVCHTCDFMAVNWWLYRTGRSIPDSKCPDIYDLEFVQERARETEEG